jgi:hypothetical protein
MIGYSEVIRKKRARLLESRPLGVESYQGLSFCWIFSAREARGRA